MMKIIHKHAITLLLTFLACTLLTISYGPIHAHSESKAIVMLDDWNMVSQWDDEKHYASTFPSFALLESNFSIGICILAALSTGLVRRFIFLVPVFHQSNYVIYSPELVSQLLTTGREELMWIRFLMIGVFSLTAAGMLTYQGIEIYHAFMDFFKQKQDYTGTKHTLCALLLVVKRNIFFGIKKA